MTRTKVLAVDDDKLVTELVRFSLERVNIACDTASSAERALQLMGRNLYAVVVADIHMPGMGGVQLISALKAISPLVQVIMLTCDNSMEQVIACADHGAVDFFEKRAGFDGLMQSVQISLSRCERWIEWMGLPRHPITAGEHV